MIIEDFLDSIICGDCSGVLAQLPENSIDTSPPYDNLRKYNGYTFDFEAIARQLYRVTKIGGVVVWIVGDATIKGSETGTSFKQALFFKEVGFNLHDTMIYAKNAFSFPESNRYYPQFEYMFVFSKGKPKTTNLLRDRKNKQYGATQKSHLERYASGKEIRPNRKHVTPEYGIRGNIWYYNVGIHHSSDDKIAFTHAATMSEKLAEDHILSWSNPNDIILDPMCGSGTTLKMARKNDRRYIGIDISEEYCELSRQRVALADQQVIDNSV